MKKYIFPVILVFFGSPLWAQSWQDTVKLVDQVFGQYAPENPGAQLAISRHGKIIYSSARGMADLEHSVPMTSDSRTEAGSVSKQFTAAAILLLEQQGKLGQQDDIRKYLPELRDYGHRITISHLLRHTSGLKDWGSIAELSGWPRGTRAYNNEDALHYISLQKTLNNIPGAEYIYSNSNYTLLTIIAERVSGMSLTAFTSKFIFEPAGMKHTGWRDNYRRVVKGRAIAYSKSGAGFVTNMPNENTYGHAGLLTTAEDLLVWNLYYQGGQFGTPSLFPRQTETVNLNNGRSQVYGAGLVVDSVNGWLRIAHSGATAGYRANLENFPQLGLSIAWLSNNAQAELAGFASVIRNLLVKDITSPRARPDTVAMVNLKYFHPWIGAYRNALTGEGERLILKADSIILEGNRIALRPVNDHTLALGQGRLVFSAPRVIQYIRPVGDTVLLSGMEPAAEDEQKLREYAGIYYSEETETSTHIDWKNGKLILSRRPGQETVLVPVYKDGFRYAGGDLYFIRDKKGRISHFLVSISRARQVRFAKKTP